jgi:selenocysteine lyase/cysteine desulfurase
VRIYGLTAPEDLVRRVPTVMITVAGHTPRALAEALGARGIFCWDGNYYALALMERLGLEEHGGALRIGAVHCAARDRGALTINTTGWGMGGACRRAYDAPL